MALLVRRLIVFVAACFLVAVFVHFIRVVHIELLMRSYVAGFNQGRVECVKPQTYFPEYLEDYDGGT